LVPTRDRSIAAPSKNHRYSTNQQVVIDADTQLVVAVGTPLPGNRNDCKAFGESGAEYSCRNVDVIADGGYIATSAIIPHRRRPGEALPEWQEAHNASHRQVRARVEHAFARMKAWKVLRDCRLRGDGVAVAMLGIARLHNLAGTLNPIAGQPLVRGARLPSWRKRLRCSSNGGELERLPELRGHGEVRGSNRPVDGARGAR
jgi:hypothetical protein